MRHLGRKKILMWYLKIEPILVSSNAPLVLSNETRILSPWDWLKEEIPWVLWMLWIYFASRMICFHVVMKFGSSGDCRSGLDVFRILIRIICTLLHIDMYIIDMTI